LKGAPLNKGLLPTPQELQDSKIALTTLNTFPEP
jgi:hypothetical protein